MSIAPKTTTITGPGNPGWLGSAHGTDATRTVTLDASKFTAGTHYPNGFIRGGTPVAKITATGKFGPYTPADSTTGLGVLVDEAHEDARSEEHSLNSSH